MKNEKREFGRELQTLAHSCTSAYLANHCVKRAHLLDCLVEKITKIISRANSTVKTQGLRHC